MRLSKSIAFISVLGLLLSNIPGAQALTVPNSFKKLATSSTLAKPGIIVFDPTTQTEIYSDLADVPRAPASVLKLISATAALTAFEPEKVFHTTINSTDDPDVFIMQGERDPWLTTSSRDAKRFNRALSPKLINERLTSSLKTQNTTAPPPPASARCRSAMKGQPRRHSPERMPR